MSDSLSVHVAYTDEEIEGNTLDGLLEVVETTDETVTAGGTPHPIDDFLILKLPSELHNHFSVKNNFLSTIGQKSIAA